MPHPKDLLTKIVHGVYVGDETTEVHFTDGSILHITTEWDDYAECSVLKTYYKDDLIEGSARDDG